MSSRCLLLFACVACGTNEPVHADAMPDTAFVPHRAVVVNAMVSMPITGTSTTIPLPATTAGNLLVVGVALSGAQGLTVQTITLPDNRYFTREIGLWLSACDHAFETWASWNVPAGVDAIEVHFAGPVSAAAYVLEVAGLSQVPLSQTQNAGDPAGMLPPYTPTLPAPEGALVVSTITTCDSLTGLTSSSPFTALPAHYGADLAYMVAPNAGDHGAVWSYTGAMWQSVVAFR